VWWRRTCRVTGAHRFPACRWATRLPTGIAVVTDLGLGEPILAGLSLGGWAALRYAATCPCRALVCLDGPTNLDYEAMGIRPNHPGFVPDRPDVPADFASLRCPAMVVLCAGESPDDAERMVPFRAGLAEHLTKALPGHPGRVAADRSHPRALEAAGDRRAHERVRRRGRRMSYERRCSTADAITSRSTWAGSRPGTDGPSPHGPWADPRPVGTPRLPSQRFI
jgi:pimeloyl-ACP methyl ester carboxylesterase